MTAKARKPAPSSSPSLAGRIRGIWSAGTGAFARGSKAPYIVLLLLLIAFPIVDGNQSHIGIAQDAGRWILLALGLNIVVGYAGLLDLGYAAFFAIGAYSYAMLASGPNPITSVRVEGSTGPSALPSSRRRSYADNCAQWDRVSGLSEGCSDFRRNRRRR